MFFNFFLDPKNGWLKRLHICISFYVDDECFLDDIILILFDDHGVKMQG